MTPSSALLSAIRSWFPVPGSDARVPRIPAFGCCRSAALTESLQVIRDCQAAHVFEALVAELARHAHPERTTECHGQIAVIHSVGHQRLRMQGLGHIDAVP